jgi:hypothetical protein
MAIFYQEGDRVVARVDFNGISKGDVGTVHGPCDDRTLADQADRMVVNFEGKGRANFLKSQLERARPPPMHMKTRETHRQVLLGLYFQRLADPEWMNEVLAEYDLSNDTDDLISNGIKKGSDLGILMHEPSLLKDLSMTLIAKAKLRMLLNDLSETCNAHPEKDATMAATLDDVELTTPPPWEDRLLT